MRTLISFQLSGNFPFSTNFTKLTFSRPANPPANSLIALGYNFSGSGTLLKFPFLLSWENSLKPPSEGPEVSQWLASHKFQSPRLCCPFSLYPSAPQGWSDLVSEQQFTCITSCAFKEMNLSTLHTSHPSEVIESHLIP